MAKPIISADSHITEPPDCYRGNIESRFADTAPYITELGELGDVFVIDGLPTPVPLGLGQTAVTSVDAAVSELRKMKEMGFRRKKSLIC